MTSQVRRALRTAGSTSARPLRTLQARSRACSSATPIVTTFHGTDAVRALAARSLVDRGPKDAADRGRARVAANLGLREAAVIPCAVDLDLFAPLDRRAASRALGWPINRPCVLFPAARDDRRKTGNKRLDVFDEIVRAPAEPGWTSTRPASTA